MPPDDLRAAVSSTRVILSRCYGVAIGATLAGSLAGLLWLADPFGGDGFAYTQLALWLSIVGVLAWVVWRDGARDEAIRELQDGQLRHGRELGRLGPGRWGKTGAHPGPEVTYTEGF